MAKTRARHLIIRNIVFPHAVTWTHETPIPGDLVGLVAKNPEKWALSWLVDAGCKKGRAAWLLESIEDGELCWWSNVCLRVFNREIVSPRWRWTDKQFVFSDRFERIATSRRHFPVLRPLIPDFGEKYSVTLRLFNAVTKKIEKEETFNDFRRVKSSEIKKWCEAK